MIVFSTCPKCGSTSVQNVYGKNCVKGSFCNTCFHSEYPEVKVTVEPEQAKTKKKAG